MKSLLKTGIITFALFFSAAAFSAPHSSSPIEFFSELRKDNTKLLIEVDQSLDRLLATTSGLEPLGDMERRVEFLKERRKELLARQEFLNRLILQFDKNFRGGDVHDFLKVALREMSQVEVKNEEKSDKAQMWKFLNYLAISLDSLPKNQMDVLHFVEGYMKRSSFRQPTAPKEYLSSLDYYNDTQAHRANSLEPAEAAEIVH